MVWNIALGKGFVCVLALWLGFTLPLCKARIYTNHWAVRIAGGPEFADRIASKYGYKNMGQIGDLKDYYHFFHSRTIKRSTLSSRGRHSFISMEPKSTPPDAQVYLSPETTCRVMDHCPGQGWEGESNPPDTTQALAPSWKRW
ncbi:hypothetical protein SKAU_G00016530 [Synaphobranchus kaupii]|uniref:Peptidase S8 pro-domain domain-containing protein n=1 Tax=Synaphobranchus kaupii TaxID=118154 RepID=A0A9Q1GC76_SYNKA|nr:hypothetical protein SKAU_G00016530 [Synaphobranchus kaupii]